ncbi:uncharacterized protein EI97DRAFT_459931 [Westerdykella ornata]|uniref:CBF1-interacting co-repressor CIR N-terminal domain-containing protein n=1 Tax=Westerdykella ornata TaxID=318751 RepID=A0A6A6JHD2_WESOR|nr:uncharacterized protein EI97DRAFT_459931 [Westerdykella ornata]KAF2274649.1 hypothetical protein EI97DRAFT_459931 [Westerdykella ornata]
MPLHLLGKKSWNVYNAANIARVKADEAAAAAREAAEEQRMQELDAERRAAILRGRTPPPLPADVADQERKARRTERGRDGHDRKRRRLAGEDDTDRDIRLAQSMTGPKDDGDLSVLKLRKPENEAPLTDHAGNINLFPVDVKEAVRREKNAEAEKEKSKKEQAFEDQYTMRLANAAGKGSSGQPWYLNGNAAARSDKDEGPDRSLQVPGFSDKDVWGNEDPGRKERQKARIASSDPLAFMNQAQIQLKKSREDRKKWAEERERELRELRAAQERDERRHRHRKRKRREEGDAEPAAEDGYSERRSSSKYEHHRRSRSRSPRRRHEGNASHRHGSRRSRSRSRERDRKLRRASSPRYL